MIPYVRAFTFRALLGCMGAGVIALTACAPPGATGPSASSPASPGSLTSPASPTSRDTPVPPRPGNPKERRHAPAAGGPAPVFSRATARPGSAVPRTVALTFDADMTADQGPRAARGERFDNPGLIDALRTLKVPSTVFMTGRWAEEYPAQARSIGTDPLFETANHSYSHHAFTPGCYGLPVVDRTRMLADVERARQVFERVGVRNAVPYFRFPGGCHDDDALRAVAPAGVTAVQWDVVSGDAFATDAGAVAEQVLAGVEPGSLVVMHCTRSAAPVTEQAVRRIVPELRRRGYRFVKVSELMRG